MPSYLHPGVYIEEVPSGSKPIEAVGTSTAAFVGFTTKGTLKEPTLITSWEDYETIFGGFREYDPEGELPDDLMGRSVYAYFQNGGSKAYVVRIAGGSPQASVGELADEDGTFITFKAANEGIWGRELTVRLTAKDKEEEDSEKALFTVAVGTKSDGKLIVREQFEDLSLDPDSPNFISDVLKEESRLIRVDGDLDSTDKAIKYINNGDNDKDDEDAMRDVALTDGDDGESPGKEDYKNIFSKFLKYRDINILMLPDTNWGDDRETIESAISHCETMKNRMVIFDLDPEAELKNEKQITDLNLTTSSYAATYYPWPRVSNPFYDPEKNRSAPRLLSVPASAYAAGQWAKTDANRGVWKAPAGVGSNLFGVNKLTHTVEDAEQDYLNPQGINALRQLPNYGSVIWGTRTRATKADPEWRYIPVRRTAMFIEESIFNGIHWAVFEPNDHRLWSALRLNIESFMSGLHRSGAFQGEKSSDAYFVRCGLGQTMTQGDIDRGQVIVQVGFAPLKPAEFVIVRIQQKVGQQ